MSLSVLPQHDLTVSLFISGDSGPVSMHPLALQTSFVSTPGDFVARDDGVPFLLDDQPIQLDLDREIELPLGKLLN